MKRRTCAIITFLIFSLLITSASLVWAYEYASNEFMWSNGVAPVWQLLKKQVFAAPSTESGNALMAWDGASNVFFYQPFTSVSQMWRLNLKTLSLVRIDKGNMAAAYSGATVVYAAGKLYFTLGGDYGYFYSMTTSGVLTSLSGIIIRAFAVGPPAPNFGCSMRWDGADTIWMLGANVQFARYSIHSNTWTVLADYGNNSWLTEGTSITLVGNYVYGMAGAGQQIFQRYSIQSNTWTSLASTPGTVYDGGQLAWDHGNYVYAFRGIGSQDFWRYDIATGQWQILGSLPVPASSGSTLYYAGSGGFLAYIAEPDGLTSYGIVSNLYRYT